LLSGIHAAALSENANLRSAGFTDWTATCIFEWTLQMERSHNLFGCTARGRASEAINFDCGSKGQDFVVVAKPLGQRLIDVRISGQRRERTSNPGEYGQESPRKAPHVHLFLPCGFKRMRTNDACSQSNANI
jgi:hypothetical protein